jgi:hypothetical protein
MSEIGPSYEERMRILEMIEQGVISSAQGAELIRALEGDEDEAETWDDPEPFSIPDPHLDPEPEPVAYHSPTPDPGRGYAETPRGTPPPVAPPLTRLARWRNWWYYPLGFGILVTVFSGWLIYLGNQNTWHGFWMACIWLPLLFGMFVIVLSWYSHRSLWMHVRVNTGQDEWPRRIAISLPLPLEFGAWVMRTFRQRIPGIPNLDDVPLDEIIQAVRRGVKPESPIYVQVEEAGAEKVEVYIG